MTGTFSLNVGALQKTLNDEGLRFMSDPTFRRNKMEVLGRRFLRNIDREFSMSADPYGSAWPPGKKKRGKTLINTTLLRRSFNTVVEGSDTLKIGVSGPAGAYGGFHQTGTKYLPQRLMLPTMEKGWPTIWLKQAHDVILEGKV